MSTLNEVCLHHIFSNLKPRDLINVSKVCKLWKKLSERQWQRIDELGYHENNSNMVYVENQVENLSTEEVLEARVAKEIVNYIAPHIRIVRAYDDNFVNNQPFQFLKLGHFWYRVNNLDIQQLLMKLERVATRVEHLVINHYSHSSMEKLGSLFRTNNVTALQLSASDDYFLHIWPQNITSFHVKFTQYNHDIHSFRRLYQNCPNLSALTIEIVWWPVDPERMLAQILQHALGIRSLHLGINVGAQVDCTFVFDQIAALTQLEVLHIELNNMLLLNQENFYSRLANSCPRIRDLAITGSSVTVDKSSLPLFLALPKLQKLTVDVVFDFSGMEVPQTETLSDLKLLHLGCDVDSLIDDFIGKLTRLRKLTIEIEELEEDDWMDLVCRTIFLFASQGRNMIVNLIFHSDLKCSTKLAIVKHNGSHSDVSENITITFTALDDMGMDFKEFYLAIKDYVKNSLHHVFSVE